MTPALRCNEWTPPAQPEVRSVKDGRVEAGFDGGVRQGEADGSHLLTVGDGHGGEQGHVQVGSKMDIPSNQHPWAQFPFQIQW